MPWLRTLVERALRDFTLWRTLPNGRKVVVSPDARLSYLKPRFDQDIVALASRVPEQAVVWDVGANCGVFAFACDGARQVIAVEPDPFLASLIERSRRRNGTPVQIVQCAVSDAPGEGEFAISRRGRAASHLAAVPGSSQSGGERGRLRVELRTLDQLLDRFGPPDFVKIDVEGAEHLVLRGARRLLDARPTLYVEVMEANAVECRAILTDAGYRIEVMGDWLATPMEREPA